MYYWTQSSILVVAMQAYFDVLLLKEVSTSWAYVVFIKLAIKPPSVLLLRQKEIKRINSLYYAKYTYIHAMKFCTIGSLPICT